MRSHYRNLKHLRTAVRDGNRPRMTCSPRCHTLWPPSVMSGRSYVAMCQRNCLLQHHRFVHNVFLLVQSIVFQQLRRHILDLLSPIAQHHQQAFLQALSLVWLTRSAEGNGSPRKTDCDHASFAYTPSQLHIASLLLSLKVIPFEELLSAVCETLKEAGAKVSKFGLPEKAAFPTEAPLLELVHGCIKALQPTQLRQCWPSVQALLNDVPLASLPPRAIFLLFM